MDRAFRPELDCGGQHWPPPQPLTLVNLHVTPPCRFRAMRSSSPSVTAAPYSASNAARSRTHPAPAQCESGKKGGARRGGEGDIGGQGAAHTLHLRNVRAGRGGGGRGRGQESHTHPASMRCEIWKKHSLRKPPAQHLYVHTVHRNPENSNDSLKTLMHAAGRSGTRRPRVTARHETGCR